MSKGFFFLEESISIAMQWGITTNGFTWRSIAFFFAFCWTSINFFSIHLRWSHLNEVTYSFWRSNTWKVSPNWTQFAVLLLPLSWLLHNWILGVSPRTSIEELYPICEFWHDFTIFLIRFYDNKRFATLYLSEYIPFFICFLVSIVLSSKKETKLYLPLLVLVWCRR